MPSLFVAEGSDGKDLFGLIAAANERFNVGISRSPFHGSLEMKDSLPVSFWAGA